MKKSIIIVLALFILLSSFGANAASVPQFMKQPINNYTADYTVTMEFSGADEIVTLLTQANIINEIEKYINVSDLLTSLLNTKSAMKIEARISDDYRRADIALSGQASQKIVVNSNLNSTINAKMAMWLHIDMDKKEFSLIYLTPTTNKYMVFDAASDLPQEVSNQVFEALDKFFSKEFISQISDTSLEFMLKHADIKMTGNKCTVRYDNKSIVNMIDDVNSLIAQATSDIPLYASAPELPSLKGLDFLGKDGLCYTYELKGTKLSRVTMDADVKISIKQIYEKLTGEKWPFECEGNISFKSKTTANISKLGTTNPVMPKITEENSFRMVNPDIFYNEYEYNYEAEPYIAYYVACYECPDTFDGKTYYMPLRYCIEDAFYNCNTIDYSNGLVAIDINAADYSRSIAFDVSGKSVAVNGIEYDVDGFKIIDGSIYASADFYEKSFGWTLDSLQKDLLDGTLSFGFETNYYK